MQNKTLFGLTLLVSVAAMFLLNGCSALGFAVGSKIDDSSTDRNIIPGSQVVATVAKVEPGTVVQITQKNGSRLSGEYLGIHDSNGNIIEGEKLKELISDGRIPLMTASAIVIKSNLGTTQVPMDSVRQIEVPVSVSNLTIPQENRWQIKFSDGKNGKIISHLSLERLNGDSLKVQYHGTLSIPVQSILEIRLVRESQFGKGAAIGSGVGAVLGVISATNIKEEPPKNELERAFRENFRDEVKAAAIFVGILGGGLIGGAIGGIIGAAAGADEVYDLSQMNPAGKLTMIQVILSREKQTKQKIN